jgi:hypothetical protein
MHSGRTLDYPTSHIMTENRMNTVDNLGRYAPNEVLSGGLYPSVSAVPSVSLMR